jgi:hypothetical protein
MRVQYFRGAGKFAYILVSYIAAHYHGDILRSESALKSAIQYIPFRKYLAGVLHGMANRSIQDLAELTPTACAAKAAR